MAEALAYEGTLFDEIAQAPSLAPIWTPGVAYATIGDDSCPEGAGYGSS